MSSSLEKGRKNMALSSTITKEYTAWIYNSLSAYTNTHTHTRTEYKAYLLIESHCLPTESSGNGSVDGGGGDGRQMVLYRIQTCLITACVSTISYALRIIYCYV